MGTEVLYMRPPLTAAYWTDKERRREEARAELLRRGYTAREVAAIVRGEWFWVVAAHKEREQLTRRNWDTHVRM
jgi:hypothetical protein